MAPRKRKAPKTPITPKTPDEPDRRRSTRIGSTGKKSQYFESDSGTDSDDAIAAKRARTDNGVKHSGRRGPRVESDASEDDFEAPDDDDDDEDEDEDDHRNAISVADEHDSDEEIKKSSSHKPSKKNGVKISGTAARASRGNTDSDPDDQDEDNWTTFEPHKKLRDQGGVEYTDERLHQNTLLFLKDLKANNVRSFLKSNDAEYRRSLGDWSSLVEVLTPRIVDLDDTIPELQAKDIVFRIYRDIRFSKDPTPYKPYYSAAWSRSGRKGPYACYYVHCEPGKSFVGGGLWQPEAESLRRLRASIDERPRKWKKSLVEDDRLRHTFLPKAKKGDEKSIIKAFSAENARNALKKKPRDYPADHRHIELLKLRNFTISKKVADNVFTSANCVDQIMEIVGGMVGFITHLNSIVMPDGDADDDDDGDDDNNNNNNGEGNDPDDNEEATDATE